MGELQPPALFGSPWSSAPPTMGAVVHWIERLFFLPGDWIVWAIAARAPRVAALLGLSADDYGGVISGLVSAIVWLTVFLIAATLYTAATEFGRTLAQRVSRFYGDVRARLRIALRLADYRLHHRRPSHAQRRIEPVLELSEEIEVSVPELKVLHAHLNLKPGGTLPVSEIASAVGARKADLHGLLRRLEKLHLLKDGPSRINGEKAYALTAAGRAFLVFRQMSARAARPSISAGRPMRKQTRV